MRTILTISESRTITRRLILLVNRNDVAWLWTFDDIWLNLWLFLERRARMFPTANDIVFGQNTKRPRRIASRKTKWISLDPWGIRNYISCMLHKLWNEVRIPVAVLIHRVANTNSESSHIQSLDRKRKYPKKATHIQTAMPTCSNASTQLISVLLQPTL